LIPSANFSPSSGDIDIDAAQLATNVKWCQTNALHPERVEADADLPFNATYALNAAHPGDTLQSANDDILDEIGKLFGRFSGSNCGVGKDRKSYDIDASDEGLVYATRKISSHASNGVCHVSDRPIGRSTQTKLDRCSRNAVGNSRHYMMGALDAGHGVLDFLSNLRFKFRW
jgi:hypothetical protein